jgi:adenosylmethionine-8-amino-7-oxononanoate aminotransferase
VREDVTVRMASHFETNADMPRIGWGKGSWLYDKDGNAYLDGSGGPALFCLGHAHPEVNEALHRQLDRIAHGYRYDFTSEPLEELTDLIARQAERHIHHRAAI